MMGRRKTTDDSSPLKSDSYFLSFRGQTTPQRSQRQESRYQKVIREHIIEATLQLEDTFITTAFGLSNIPSVVARELDLPDLVSSKLGDDDSDRSSLDETETKEGEKIVPSSSSSSSTALCKKSVSFSNLEIRQYNIVLGDHPCCLTGCPIELGWEHSDGDLYSIDHYEATRDRRRAKKELRTTLKERRDLLSEFGNYTIDKLQRITPLTVPPPQSAQRSQRRKNPHHPRMSKTSRSAVAAVAAACRSEYSSRGSKNKGKEEPECAVEFLASCALRQDPVIGAFV